MGELFSQEVAELADAMGVALYQRFSMQEASLFLRCSVESIALLTKQGSIGYLSVVDGEIIFFGYQLVEHLSGSIQQSQTPVVSDVSSSEDDRILRMKEVQKLTGVSRSTIWRLEKSGQFPRRVVLGLSSIGWLKSDVLDWINQRKS
jgi:predicted DNA-binding transcriptional regulator AlpA